MLLSLMLDLYCAGMRNDVHLTLGSNLCIVHSIANIMTEDALAYVLVYLTARSSLQNGQRLRRFSNLKNALQKHRRQVLLGLPMSLAIELKLKKNDGLYD